MTQVLTLIAGEDSALSAAQVDAVAQALGAAPVRTNWLEEGQACDLYLESGDIAAIQAAAIRALGAQKIDVLVQLVDGRRKRLLLADMESTLIVDELLDEMAKSVGVRDKVAAITARAMNGELDFQEALAERVALMRGVSQSVLEALARDITFMPGAETLIATLKAKGVPCYIASGGFTFFAERVARHLGCDGISANQLEIADGCVTGKLLPPILGRAEKKTVLEEFAARHNLTVGETMAVGDGANDLDMLSAAGMGVGFRPKPVLAAAVHHKLRYADLTALLFVQGYRADEFVR